MCDATCGPTFERTRLMCTSTVRVPPQYSKPHTRCSSVSREYAREGCVARNERSEYSMSVRSTGFSSM